MRAIRWQAIASLIVLCGGWTTVTTHAGQSVSGWTPPRKMSTGGFAMYPFVVSDGQGRVHLLWSENTREPDNELALDSIQYAVIDDSGETNPVDVFVAPPGGQARLARVRVDDADRLHMLVVTWPGLVYGVVDASFAWDAKAWETDTFPENVFTADFSLSEDGTVDLVYTLSNQGIFHRRGRIGEEWTAPSAVWMTSGDDQSSGSVRIESQPSDILHTAWGITAEENNWNPIGIAYARSIDGGESWDSTFELFEGDNQPALGFHGENGVVLFWNNPAGKVEGRGGTYSLDQGVTWAPGMRMYPRYRGQTYPAAMVQDSDGRLHLIFTANPPDDGYAHAFHATWNEGIGWGEPEEISGDHLGMEGPSATIALGNRLYVAWFTYDKEEYGVWLVSTTVDAEAVAPRAAESRLQPIRHRVTPTPAARSTRVDVVSRSTQIPVRTVESFSDGPTSSGLPILIGVTLAGLITLPLAWKYRRA